jgi:hypothetical protein
VNQERAFVYLFSPFSRLTCLKLIRIHNSYDPVVDRKSSLPWIIMLLLLQATHSQNGRDYRVLSRRFSFTLSILDSTYYDDCSEKSNLARALHCEATSLLLSARKHEFMNFLLLDGGYGGKLFSSFHQSDRTSILYYSNHSRNITVQQPLEMTCEKILAVRVNSKELSSFLGMSPHLSSDVHLLK